MGTDSSITSGPFSIFGDFIQSGAVRRNVSISGNIQASIQEELRLVQEMGVVDIFALAFELCTQMGDKIILTGDVKISALPWLAYLGGWSELNPEKNNQEIDERKIQELALNRTITWHTVLPFFSQTETLVRHVQGAWFPTTTTRKHSLASSLAVLGDVLSLSRTTRKKLSVRLTGKTSQQRHSRLSSFEKRVLRSARNVVGTHSGVSYPAQSWTYLSPAILDLLPSVSQYRRLNWRHWKRRNCMTWDDWKELGGIRVDFKVYWESNKEL